ncbi:MAG: DUF1273 family protein [Chloroflexi bacterium]|nr:DUF1273 family protein [Chloroflexota bacterium]
MPTSKPPMRVGWTGHRPHYFRAPAEAAAAVQRAAEELRREVARPLVFITGGQRGVDLWAAEAAMQLGVPYHVYLPLPLAQFAADWDAADRAALERVWAAAAERRVLDERGDFGPGAYTLRNQAIAEECDLLVAVWTGRTGGGTHETVSFARALSKPIREVLLPAADVPSDPAARGL